MQSHKAPVEAGQLAPVVACHCGQVRVSHLTVPQHAMPADLILGRRVWSEAVPDMLGHGLQQRQRLHLPLLAQSHGQAKHGALHDGAGGKTAIDSGKPLACSCVVRVRPVNQRVQRIAIPGCTAPVAVWHDVAVIRLPAPDVFSADGAR